VTFTDAFLPCPCPRVQRRRERSVRVHVCTSANDTGSADCRAGVAAGLADDLHDRTASKWGLLNRCAVQPWIRRPAAGDTAALRASAFTRPAPFIINRPLARDPKDHRFVSGANTGVSSNRIGGLSSLRGQAWHRLPDTAAFCSGPESRASGGAAKAASSAAESKNHSDTETATPEGATLRSEPPGGELPKEIPGGCRSRCCSRWMTR
jgi:hypothetical protein